MFYLFPPCAPNVVSDTACTSHCFHLDTQYKDQQPVHNCLCFGLPNGTSIQDTHTGLLPADGPIPPLLTNARRVILFSCLSIKALISVGQFCNDGYSAVFTTNTVRHVKDGVATVVGHCNCINGLWEINLTASTPPSNPPT